MAHFHLQQKHLPPKFCVAEAAAANQLVHLGLELGIRGFVWSILGSIKQLTPSPTPKLTLNRPITKTAAHF